MLNRAFQAFVEDQNGATAIEYGVLVAIFSVAFIPIWAWIGQGVDGALDVSAVRPLSWMVVCGCFRGSPALSTPQRTGTPGTTGIPGTAVRLFAAEAIATA